MEILTIRNFPLSREANINYLIEREDNVNFLNFIGSYRGTLINNKMTNCHFWYADCEYYSACLLGEQFYQDELG